MRGKRVNESDPVEHPAILKIFADQDANAGPPGSGPQHRIPECQPMFADRLHRRAKDADRDPKTIGLAYRVTQRGKAIPERADNGERRLFSGDDAAIVGDLRALRDLGVSDVDFSFDGATADEVIANMKRFREDVLAKV